MVVIKQKNKKKNKQTAKYKNKTASVKCGLNDVLKTSMGFI